MNSQLDKALCIRYPSLLFSKDMPNSDQFFFECGDGWFNIINATLNVIYKKNTTNNLEASVTQVKEKFGLLRIYCRHGDDYTNAVTNIAELISQLTCEICGNAGVIQTIKGWNQVRCDTHKLTTASNSNIPALIPDEYSSNLARAVESVLDLFGSNPQWALKWLKEPLTILGYKKPYEMLQTHEGCSTVIRLIYRLEHGVLP
ncbi:antitoxin Xre/MbcA/ParS toxin-binding domain-containing protein [Pseudomonas sp. GB2N2]